MVVSSQNQLNHTQMGLTPCAGRCSTVFGDAVCRGCRRYAKEVIDWNTYTPEQQALIWQRLDTQLDQIILPLIVVQNNVLWQQFKGLIPMRLPANASEGRYRYEALRVLVRQSHLLLQSGLLLEVNNIRPLWHQVEKKILSLATAIHDMTWIRYLD